MKHKFQNGLLCTCNSCDKPILEDEFYSESGYCLDCMKESNKVSFVFKEEDYIDGQPVGPVYLKIVSLDKYETYQDYKDTWITLQEATAEAQKHNLTLETF